MIDKKLLNRLSIPRLKHLAKLPSWCEKVMHAIFIVIGRYSATSWRIKTRTRTLRLRKSMTLYLLTRVIVEMKANYGKFQISLKTILVRIAKASRINLLILPPLVITSSLSRNTKNRMIKIGARSNIISTIKIVIMLISVLTKSQKTSVSFSNFRVGDCS